MAPSEPKLKPSEIRRKKLIQNVTDAMAASLAEHGYYSTSIEDIAAQLDLTKGALYYYWASKEDLALESVTHVADLVYAEVDAIAKKDSSAANRLHELISKQADMLVSDYAVHTRLFFAVVDWPVDFEPHISALRHRYERVFRRVIDEGVASGEFSMPSVTVARFCIQGALAYLPIWYKSNKGIDAPEIGEAMAATLRRIFSTPA